MVSPVGIITSPQSRRVSKAQVCATCLNEPYHMPGLAMGTTVTRPLSAVSGFCITGPTGSTRPDDVYAAQAIAVHDRSSRHALGSSRRMA